MLESWHKLGKQTLMYFGHEALDSRVVHPTAPYEMIKDILFLSACCEFMGHWTGKDVEQYFTLAEEMSPV